MNHDANTNANIMAQAHVTCLAHRVSLNSSSLLTLLGTGDLSSIPVSVMSRPRESILNLFDPLNLSEPSTPVKRESAWSPDSDKENSEPPEPGQMTAFFNKIYSGPEVMTASVKPMARLVDVGDVTVAMDDWMSEDEQLQEEGEDLQGTFAGEVDVEQTPRHDLTFTNDEETPMHRRPFTDITPDATPIAPKRTYRSDEVGSGSEFATAPQISPSTTRAPLGSPLASIINAINFAASDEDQLPQISVSSPTQEPTELSPTFSTTSLASSHPFESLTHIVSPAQSPSNTDTLASSTAHLVPSDTSALLTQFALSESMNRPLSPPCAAPPIFIATTRSRTPSPTKPNEPWTHDSLTSLDIDIDLHSSFNIHLQNQDNSFDLLNDKISFFHGGGMDSTLLDAGPDIDIEGEDDIDGVGINNVTMGDFDVKDEEGRMRAFLRLSAGWEDEPIVTPGAPEALADSTTKSEF